MVSDIPLTLTFRVVTIIQRVCLITADAIVVMVTIYHTQGILKAGREANVPTTFSRTVLRAGQAAPPTVMSHTLAETALNRRAVEMMRGLKSMVITGGRVAK